MFENQIVVISGGSSGIGLATAEQFAAQGASSVYNLDIQKPERPIRNVEFVQCDVRVPEQVREKIAGIHSSAGRIDVVFANAGVFTLGDIEETDDEVLSRVVGTNILGTWWVVQASIGFMKRQKRGSIILCGSDQSLVGRRKSAAYGLTKGAIGQLTKSLALDYAQHGIRVNCICPAAVDTPLCRQAIRDWIEKYGGDVEQLTRDEHALQPIGRMASPIDIANVVIFLASEGARNMTGALVSVDGGYVAQ